MKEGVFIHQRQEKWREMERLLVLEPTGTYDRFIQLYDQIADDLSYAQAHYPDSKLIAYLNELVVQSHAQVYARPIPVRYASVIEWLIEVGVSIRDQRSALLMSLGVFVLAIAIGWVSSLIDPDFCRLVMGDGYVDMTLRNIKNGDPMAVYAGDGQAGMFLRIGQNNIRVSFIAFALGILTTIGPLFILFTNGVMVGTFFHLFYQQKLAALAWTTVMIHGTLELSAIVIAGAAGICIGNAILYPGSYTRLVSLRRAAKDAVRIMLSLVPVFIVAAFLEGYVTRLYMTLGMAGRVGIILLSVVAIYLFYFHYPHQIKTNDTLSRT